ncbi:MAG: hypothetical protein Q8888_02315 [Vigna little leaf phytoplasma]|nr:hypothetical protein [Vigna little leaf phytoplasma]
MLFMMIFHLSLHIPISAHSFFYRQKKHSPRLANYATLEQEWLATQPKLKRYDYRVLTRAEIPRILTYHNIPDVSVSLGTSPCHFNAYGEKKIYWWLKNPPPGLFGVYFKPRENLFQTKYPHGDYIYTLEDLLTYESAIEEVFVFWDARQQPIPSDVNIRLLPLMLNDGYTKYPPRRATDDDRYAAVDLGFYHDKQEILQNRASWTPIPLGAQRFLKEKVIRLGCYNATPTTGLVLPFPPGKYQGKHIQAVYFDEGIRVLPENLSPVPFTDLLKLANGAKNIYLFYFEREVHINLGAVYDPTFAINTWINENVNGTILTNQQYSAMRQVEVDFDGVDHLYCIRFTLKQKEHRINLPNSSDPLAAIKKWKNEQNMSFIKASNYRYEGDVMNHTCETNTAIYHLTCRHNYYEQLQSWKNQCYFKPGKYTGFEIRDKLGRSDRRLYSDDSNTVEGVYFERLYRDSLYYKYHQGLFLDKWTFEKYSFKCNWDDWITVGSTKDGFLRVDFSGYWDTTPPPTKPDFTQTFPS